jgi:hypothetical protein
VVVVVVVVVVIPSGMVCLRNICINTLHKGGSDDNK